MVRERIPFAIVPLIAAAALFAVPPASAAIDVEVINRSGEADSQVYVMLGGGSSSDGQLANEVGVPLDTLKNRRFTLESISGRIFFSYGAPVTAAEPPESKTRYDKVELTYPGVANLTAVDFFGIPFELQTRNSAGKALGKLTWKAPTKKVEKALLSIKGARKALVKTEGGKFARILSPQLSPGSYPSFKRYIGSLKGRRAKVGGEFFGSPPQVFNYAGRLGGSGTTTIDGTIAPKGGAPAAGEALSVPGSNLTQAIYTVDGPYTWGGATHMVSDNDVYAVLYRDLIAGYAWGYWGGRYGNNSAKWQGKAPFAKARKKKTKYATYNEYAATIYKYSNAYGFSFSDTGPKKVQLGLDNAATLEITILPDKKKR